MKRLKKADYIIILVLIVLIAGIAAIIAFKDSGNDAKAAATGNGAASSYRDYDGRRIGIITGGAFEDITFEIFPNSEYLYFNNVNDLCLAVEKGNIDGFLDDEPVIRMICKEDKGISYFSEMIDKDDYAFAFSKNNEKTALYRKQIDEMLAEYTANGTLKKMQDIWFGDDESKKEIDFSGLEGETIRIVTSDSNVPFGYIKDGKNVGYSVALVVDFCRRYGYKPHFEMADTASAIAGLTSNTYDMIAGSLSVTEERKESIDFSMPIYNGGIVLVVRAGEADGGAPAAAEPSYTDYNGKRLGILTGSSFEPVTLEKFPDSEHLYFDTSGDLVAALQNNKIDAFVADEASISPILNSVDDITRLKPMLKENSSHFGFRKGTERSAKLRSEFNEMLAELRGSGELEKMQDRWFSKNGSKTFDEPVLTGENGEITVGLDLTQEPFVYVVNGKPVGYAIELITEFARRYGYSLHYESGNLAAVIAGVSSGMYDVMAGTFAATEERRQSIDFSDEIYGGGMVLIVRAEDIPSSSAGGGKVEDRPLSYYAENGKIGAITGGLYEVELQKRFPDAEILQYNAQPDLAIALGEGKIDAFTCPKSAAEDFMKANSELTYLKEVFMKIPYGFAFQKADGKNELRDRMNDFLAKIQADGTYDEIVDTWFGEDESKKTVEFPAEGGQREIRYITASTMQPYSYIKDGKNAGLEVDIIARFCREYGYGLKIDSADFAGLIPAISSGTYDVASGNIMITEERAKSVDFSSVYYTTDAVAVVRKEAAAGAGSAAAEEDTPAEKQSFIESIKESFDKNFVREERYKLILEGIGTTCIITVLSVLAGSLLAFLICLFRRTDSLLAEKIANIYVKLLQGTPMVVLLMILYYVVFGKTGLSAMWVAVIGFSLNFGAYVSETLRSGIESIDPGQREAALALGYTENQAFFRFIFPQAALRQIPVYRGEIVSLLKNTSIVGYIAIKDLTKMSDIIRSRTYEAFFPLIVTAVIYFLLAFVIGLILKLVLGLLDPRAKKKNKKGGEAS